MGEQILLKLFPKEMQDMLSVPRPRTARENEREILLHLFLPKASQSLQLFVLTAVVLINEKHQKNPREVEGGGPPFNVAEFA